MSHVNVSFPITFRLVPFRAKRLCDVASLKTYMLMSHLGICGGKTETDDPFFALGFICHVDLFDNKPTGFIYRKVYDYSRERDGRNEE